MTLLVPWLLFPLVLAVLALGCARLLERVVGRQLPGALPLPVGLATLTVVAGFTTLSPRTADLTVPALVGLGIFGLGLNRRRALAGFDWRAGAGALAAFLAVGAPVIASGRATFSGYVKLDDSATFLALTDRTLEHGRDLHGLARLHWLAHHALLGDGHRRQSEPDSRSRLCEQRECGRQHGHGELRLCR